MRQLIETIKNKTGYSLLLICYLIIPATAFAFLLNYIPYWYAVIVVTVIALIFAIGRKHIDTYIQGKNKNTGLPWRIIGILIFVSFCIIEYFNIDLPLLVR